jgi:biotin operon repressor
MTNLTPTWPVWFMVREATREHPVSIAMIHSATGLSPRAIKAAVETLRRDGVAIGASRGKRSGYYEIRTADDADAYATTMWRQILSEIKTVKAMVPASRYRELLGQLPLEGAQ